MFRSQVMVPFNTPVLGECDKLCDPRFDTVYQYRVSTSSANGWKTAAVTAAVENDWRDRASRGTDSQWRIAFLELPDGDKFSDYAGFYTSDNASSRPTLSITYEYP